MSASTILRRPFFWVCATLGLLASCISDLADEPGRPGTAQGERREVTIQLDIPAATMPQTKADTDSESNPETTVNDLIVVAFQSTQSTYIDNVQADEPYLYYAVATPQTNAEGESATITWKANLRVLNDAQTFVILANTKENYVKDEANDTIISLYDRLKTLLDNATSSLPDESGSRVQTRTASTKMQLLDEIAVLAATGGKIASSGFFVMSGQSASQIISAETTQLNTPVNLLRMVSRVNVTIGTDGVGIKNFEPRSIHVYNTLTSGCIVPEGLTEGFKQAATPNIPTSATGTDAPLEYAFEEGSQALTQAIYLFEAANEVNEAAMERTERPCIVLGGLWNGKLQYWRLDFRELKNKTYFPVLRNHSYNFTLKSITGEGAASFELAFQSPTSAIDVEVVDWENGSIGNIDVSGGTFIGIGAVNFLAGKLGTIKNAEGSADEHTPLTQTLVATDGAKWTASLDQTWVRFIANGDAYTVSDGGKTVSGTGKGNLGNIELKFIVDRIPEELESRTAVMSFTLGGAPRNLTAEVVQDQSSPVFIEWNGEPVEFDGGGNLISGQSFRFGPENVKLTWKISQGGLGSISGQTSGTLQTGGVSAAGILDFGLNICGGDNPFKVGSVGGDGFFTYEGRLTLLAEKTDGTAGAATITVPIKQVKYGVQLDKKRVIITRTSKTHTVKVLSNFAWSCQGWRGKSDEDTQLLSEWLQQFPKDVTGQAGTSLETASSFTLTTKVVSGFDNLKDTEVIFEFSGKTNADGEPITASLIATKPLVYRASWGDVHFEYVEHPKSPMTYKDFIKVSQGFTIEGDHNDNEFFGDTYSMTSNNAGIDNEVIFSDILKLEDPETYFFKLPYPYHTNYQVYKPEQLDTLNFDYMYGQYYKKGNPEPIKFVYATLSNFPVVDNLKEVQVGGDGPIYYTLNNDKIARFKTNFSYEQIQFDDNAKWEFYKYYPDDTNFVGYDPLPIKIKLNNSIKGRVFGYRRID